MVCLSRGIGNRIDGTRGNLLYGSTVGNETPVKNAVILPCNFHSWMRWDSGTVGPG